MKKCENCYWNDSCELRGDICEGYFPLNDFELEVSEYNEDLHMRYRAYERLVDEFK